MAFQAKHKPIARTLHNYLELSRGSNLPTIVSNVLVGSAIAQSSLWGWHLPLAMTAMALLYTAGMAMNGAVDADFDRVMCPNRPIPSGRISKKAAYIFAAVTAATGLCLLATANWTAFACGVLLTLAIVTYNLTHKKLSVSIVIMGVCRGLVYLTAASVATAAWWRLESAWIEMPLALSVYTAVVTLVARQEHTPGIMLNRWLWWILAMCILAVAVRMTVGQPLWPIVTASLLAAWFCRGMASLLIRPSSTQKAVMIWISGICLVDAYFLSLMDRPEWSIVALACFVITARAHRVVPGS